MKKTTKLQFAALLLAGSLLAGCGGAAEPAPEPEPEPAPQEQVEPAAVADPAAYYELGLNLLSNVESENGNVLVSPISLARPLAVLADGAEGQTKAQIEGVLGFSADGTPDAELKSLAESWSGEGDTFSLADSLWVDESFNPNPQFIANAQENFGADVYDRTFDDATLSEMNSWVSENTHGMIPEILSAIDPSCALYVLDACAFEGTWEVPYAEDAVTPATFTAEDGTTSEVEMMREPDASGYLEDDWCTGFSKLYDGNRFAFVGLLPTEGTSIADFVNGIHGEQLASLIASGSQGQVSTGLPKFDGDFTLDLAGPLQRLGMTDAFDRTAADFSGITQDAAQSPVWVGEVLQKTFVEVDEEGTRAGAATEVGVEATGLNPEESQTHEVVLDRPFVYLIVDVEANVPLFMGTVGSLG